jgi:hypothetical protein
VRGHGRAVAVRGDLVVGLGAAGGEAEHLVVRYLAGQLVQATHGGLEDGDLPALRRLRSGEHRRDDRLADLGARAGDEGPAHGAD